MRLLAQLAVLVFTLVVPQLHAQDAGPTFGVPPLSPPRHPALAPGGRLGSRVPPALVAAAWADALLAKRRPVFRTPFAADTSGGVAVAPPAAAAAPPAVPAGLLGPYADIGMQLNVRFELKADQFRNLRCTATERQLALSGCEAGFPTITPNPQYAVRTGGVVAQRLHVDVDFDSQREFDANNNLRIWYEGMEDEILRRVEAGNVTFQIPSSRFISAAIPANNFGVQAIAQVGPVEVRGIFAQQKGNMVKDRVYRVGETTSQPIDRDARDLDYEPGRFFFVIDPAALPGYPAVDILALDQTARPESLTVGALRVYRRRAVAPGSTGNQNAGGVRAVACGTGPLGQRIDCTVQRAGPFEWEILEERVAYYVDPSGAWIALANRLDQNDYLAISYVTSTRADTVGTFPLEVNRDTTVVDTLRLVYDPKPGITAAAPSFRFELRNAYRVGGREVNRESLDLTLLVNQRERAPDGQPYLGVLGLALENDLNQFDQYNRLFPRLRDPGQGDPVRDLFVVFSHVTPFADSTRLAPGERNDSLYKTPRAYLTTQAPPSVFTLRLHLEASASADRSMLALNSFQIREGSERIYVRNTLLTGGGVDYSIDYTTGQVQFTHPDSLFQGGAADVRAQFEERAAFSIAPTSIYGLAARYDLGAVGQVNFTGMFQKEQSAFNRPPLGFEPSSSFIGGVSTQLRFQPDWLTRFADFLPGVRTDAPSSLAISGEVAVSKPSPNRFGQAYLEEFEGGAARFVTLTDNVWHWGGIPTSTRGAESYGFPAVFDPAHAAFLTWQSLPYNLRDGQLVPIQFLPQQIDPTIRLVGQTQVAEPVLWLMLKPDTVLGLANNRPASPDFGAPNWVRPPTNAPRWRSLTQTLSPTGIDLSRTEFLEFWVWEDGSRVARTNRTLLLFDFGSVFEDGLAFVPTALAVSPAGDTTYSGVRQAGAGRLDTERDPRTQTWNATINDEGILSDRVAGEGGIYDSTRDTTIDTLPLCSVTDGGQVIPFVFGDVRSRCGRHNGAVDTEDQDGDFALDSLSGVRSTESFVRYVFPIGDDRYYVRDGRFLPDPAGGSAGWRLYRIPFRSDTLKIGDPNLRQVQALRLTIVTPAPQTPGPAPQVYFALSRVRLVGSSWVKRSETPISGIGGERGTGIGEVVASVVSTENRDLGYTPPPGVVDEAGRRGAGFQLGAEQINERSLRVLARGLGVGERAEAYLRFTAEGDKNFLKYKSLRAWARGRGPGWEDGDLEFFIKAGKNQDNFYLYHAPARTIAWEPEVNLAFERWLALRARIEQAWLSGDTARIYPGCPDSTLLVPDSSFVMCDGPYIAHVKDPGTAPPNLAAVQEIAAGIWRVKNSVFVDQAEVWVDDIRLADVVQETGVAGAVDLSLTAADVADLSLSLSRRDGQFRQLGDDPSYVTDNAATVSSTVRVDRFLPQSWGLSLPVTASHAVSSSDPFYLTRTDIRADALAGLRRPRASTSSYAFAASRVRRSTAGGGGGGGGGGLARWLLDPLSLGAVYNTGDTRSELARASGSSYAVNLQYALAPGARTVRIAGVNLRVTPSAVTLRSGLTGSDAERFTFTVPIARPTDTLPPVLSKTRLWRNAGRLDLLPLGGVQMSVEAVSTRDLRDYGDATTIARLMRQGRGSLLGQDIGTETQRSLTTFFTVTPRLTDWIRPRASLTSGFSFTRDANARQPVRENGDSAGAFRVPVAFSTNRRFDAGTQLDLRRLMQTLLGDSARLAAWLARFAPVDLSYGRLRSSSFNRAGDVPAFAYQLALGGIDGFRRVEGQPATAAVENHTLSAGGGVALGLGLRANGTYRRTRNVAWTLRAGEQVPLRSQTRDWPNGTISWSLAPSTAGLGRVIPRIAAQLTYRETEALSEQPTFGATASVLARTLDRAYTPSVSLTLFRGIILTTDWSRSRGDRLVAGSLFRSEREGQNASLTFSFRPPGGGVGRWRSNIRTSAAYSVIANTTCLRSPGEDACVPYVDSRQVQSQLTMDTDLPSNMSAGLQMAYVLNEERQTNRKISQFVITAFVQLSASVGQLR